MRMVRSGALVAACVLAAAVGGVSARGQGGGTTSKAATQPQAATRPQAKIEFKKLTLSAVAPTQPYLRNALLPRVDEQEVGNAATLYLAATTMVREVKPEYVLKIDEALEGPLEKVSPEVLLPFRGSLGLLRQGARRTEVDWGTSFRTEGWMALVPQLSPLRTLSKALAVGIRVDVRNRDYAAAVDKLRTGYALARHLGQGSTLIEALVGMAIEGVMDERLAELIAQPEAPNFYWPLTDLPVPVVGLRQGLAYERAIWTFSIPVMKEVRAGRADADTWVRLVRGVGELQGLMEIGGTVPAAKNERGLDRARAAGLGLWAYPASRRFLIEEMHLKPAEVDAMPVGKALSVFWVESYDRAVDDLFRWFAVPYPQGREGPQKAEAELRASPYYMFNGLLMTLPSLGRVGQMEVLAERNVAALRIVEALRGYAAGHEGRLPKSLGEIAEMPIPEDPVTGKGFEYEATETGAVLSAPPEGPRGGIRWEITIRR